jgi:hypothetical protein
MKNKEKMDSKQLSLEFGGSQNNNVEKSSESTFNNITNVITFPSRQVEKSDFRARVLADLIRNKVIVD